jgi:hypothetical protein
MPRSIPIPPLALALVANLGVAGCSASSHDPPGADASSGSSSSVNLPPEDASLADASIPVAECLDAGTVIYTTRLSAPPVIARDSLSSYVWGSGQTIEVWTQDEATQIYFAGPKGGAPLSVGMYNDAVPEHEQTAGEPQPGLDFSADDLALSRATVCSRAGFRSTCSIWIRVPKQGRRCAPSRRDSNRPVSWASMRP